MNDYERPARLQRIAFLARARMVNFFFKDRQRLMLCSCSSVIHEEQIHRSFFWQVQVAAHKVKLRNGGV